MLHASWLVSSHADRAVIQPKALDRVLDRPTWHIAFLQHGVIKDDLSAWLNTRDIDLFVTSSAAELASVADDGTAYRFTHKEAQPHRPAAVRPAARQGHRGPRVRARPS